MTGDDEAAEASLVAAALSETEPSSPRLALYRTLVHNALFGVVRTMLGRAVPYLGQQGEGWFERELVTFARERGTTSHHLRDVPHAFFAWAEPRWRSLPAYVVELARYELALFAVGASPDGPSEVGPLIAHAPVVLTHAMRLVGAIHAVEDEPPDALASDGEALLVFRDPTGAVLHLRLSAAEVQIVGSLARGDTLAAAVAGSGEAVADAAGFLARLASYGVLLGGAVAPSR